jgi:TadE-like protein
MIQHVLRRRRERHDGQALVEFALAFPILAIFIFVVIQLALVLVTYYSETRVVRESARWLAVRSQTTDDSVFAQHVQDSLLPGLVGASPTVSVCTADEIAEDPACASDVVYQVGQMRVFFTPCSISSGRCTHTDRYPGKTLHVAMRYNMSNLFFLPTEFRVGSLSVRLPTQLPKYKASVMVE